MSRDRYTRRAILSLGLAVASAAAIAIPGIAAATTTTTPSERITVVAESLTALKGQSETVTVATFTQATSTASPSNYTATIYWGGLSHPSIGTVTQPGGAGTPYQVTGTHTYATTGTYPTGITVVGTTPAKQGWNQGTVTVSDLQVTCTSNPCSGTDTGSSESVVVTTTSTTGTIALTVSPTGALDCGDPFRHAPEFTTVTDTGVSTNLEATITFNNAAAGGAWSEPFEVCYNAVTPFTDYFGNADVTTGLLPLCSTNGNVAPCVQAITESPFPFGNPADLGTVTEQLLIPPGDPKWR
jgi:hypothetical protein